MTDKEKAEEYIINKYYRDWLDEESRDVILEDVYAHDKNELQAHLDGLAEGRKELEKENAQLKADLEEAMKHCKAVDDVNAKLRCCENCSNYRNEWGEQVYEGKCENCTKLSNWEMKK